MILFALVCTCNPKILKKSLKIAEKSCNQGHTRTMVPNKPKLEIFAKYSFQMWA